MGRRMKKSDASANKSTVGIAKKANVPMINARKQN